MTASKTDNAQKCQGFTLIEVIVVIVILAILAAVAVPSLIGFVTSAQERQYRQEAQNAYETVQTLFALEQAGGRDATALTDTPPGKYIDLSKPGKLSDVGVQKYLQLSGRNPAITALSFDKTSNSIRGLTLTSSDGKADLVYDAQSSTRYTIIMH
jgi:prepilin-type N-terminal cleavage/methylation domain-containing protein